MLPRPGKGNLRSHGVSYGQSPLWKPSDRGGHGTPGLSELHLRSLGEVLGVQLSCFGAHKEHKQMKKALGACLKYFSNLFLRLTESLGKSVCKAAKMMKPGRLWKASFSSGLASTISR